MNSKTFLNGIALLVGLALVTYSQLSKKRKKCRWELKPVTTCVAEPCRRLIAQELAQKEGLGIWNGNPQPPWKWRKANK
ncbi:hypothetical protein [Myxosarcina sp. GI1]|uniref:hypothetical protein n=1 Tax=Myxosarcina sp. GI1 TaxID=1541065 RepID=UPI00055B0446|nr:hypothetical protein [Myxosarcina sp. GI1]